MLEPGFYDVPKGMVATVVTHLEMTAPRASAVRSDVLRHVEGMGLEDYRSLFRQIGTPWLWFSRLKLDDQALAEIIWHKDVEVWIASDGGVDIGLVELDFRVAGECEIAFFGLVPEGVGGGWGRVMMDHAMASAWSRPIKRLHLHTCTLDSPQALGFYRHMGFLPVRQEIEIGTDPRLTDVYDLKDAPQIPVFK